MPASRPHTARRRVDGTIVGRVVIGRADGDGAAAAPWRGERLLTPDGGVYVWLPCRGGWTRIPHLDWRRARGHMPTRPAPRPREH